MVGNFDFLHLPILADSIACLVTELHIVLGLNSDNLHFKYQSFMPFNTSANEVNLLSLSSPTSLVSLISVMFFQVNIVNAGFDNPSIPFAIKNLFCNSLHLL